jgi:hypothetical protein
MSTTTKSPGRPREAKRIVLDAAPDLAEALKGVAGRLAMPQAGTIRLAVGVLADLAAELDRGGEIIIRDHDSTEHKLWLPQLGLRKRS